MRFPVNNRFNIRFFLAQRSQKKSFQVYTLFFIFLFFLTDKNTIYFCFMDKRSLDNLSNISVCVPQKKEQDIQGWNDRRKNKTYRAGTTCG